MRVSAGQRPTWWSETRRRGMVHVAGLYVVSAWLLVQLADLLAQGPLPMPPEALRHIWVALVLIFPVALVFGWRYDITREGIVRTVPHTGGEEERPLRPIDHSIIAGLSLIVAGILGLTTLEIREAIEHERLKVGIGVEEAVGPAPANSIAVLPFAVCSGREADEVLAAGLAAEVIDRLAGLGTLRVIARASSFTIAGFDLSFRQIAQPLRVKYLLTGELCREGEKLVLRVELVDELGYVVWSERYEQASDRSGRVTTTLATQVTEGVSGALGHGFKGQPDHPVNRLVYEQLVIGQEYLSRMEIERAKAAFNKALLHEPDNAEAVFALAYIVEQEALSQGDFGLDRIEEAWPLGQRALELARSQAAAGQADYRTHATIGWILYELGKWDVHRAWREAGDLDDAAFAERLASAIARFEEAETHLRSALALNPSNVGIYELLGLSMERQGIHRRSEALSVYERGLDVDPFNARVNRDVATRWAARGRYRQAMELLERFEALPAVPPEVRSVQLEIKKLQTYWAEKCELLIEMLLYEPAAFRHVGNYGHLVWFPSELVALGLTDEAEAWYRRVEKIPAEGWANVLRGWFINSYLYAVGRKPDDLQENLALLAGKTDEEILGEDLNGAWTLARAGDYERAVRLAEVEQHSRLTAPRWAEREEGPRLWLAGLYRLAGRDADAERQYEAVAGDLEAKYASGIRHPDTLANLAEAFAGLGRDDEALAMLRKAVDYHYRTLAIDARLPSDDPVPSPLERLEADPRYVAQMERMQGDLDQQAERIRAMLASYDIDELLAPTMAMIGAEVEASGDGE